MYFSLSFFFFLNILLFSSLFFLSGWCCVSPLLLRGATWSRPSFGGVAVFPSLVWWFSFFGWGGVLHLFCWVVLLGLVLSLGGVAVFPSPFGGVLLYYFSLFVPSLSGVAFSLSLCVVLWVERPSSTTQKRRKRKMQRKRKGRKKKKRQREREEQQQKTRRKSKSKRGKNKENTQKEKEKVKRKRKKGETDRKLTNIKRKRNLKSSMICHFK